MKFIFLEPYRHGTYFFDETQGGEGGDASTTTTETSTKPVNLKSAVQDAIDVVKEAVESTQKDELKEQKEEIKVDEKSEKKEEKIDEKTKEETKEDLSTEQVELAKNILRGLKHSDPKVQLRTLEIIASAAGKQLSDIKVEGKSEAKIEATVTDLLKQSLGDWDFLAERLGPGIEKIVTTLVEKNTKEIKEYNAQQKLEAQKADIDKQLNEAFGEFENSETLKDDVFKLMDQFQASRKVSPKDYFRNLLIIAANNKGISLAKKGQTETTKERIKANREDAQSRLASERNAEVKEPTARQGKMSLKESVKDAVEKAAEQMAQKGRK